MLFICVILMFCIPRYACLINGNLLLRYLGDVEMRKEMLTGGDGFWTRGIDQVCF